MEWLLARGTGQGEGSRPMEAVLRVYGQQAVVVSVDPVCVGRRAYDRLRARDLDQAILPLSGSEVPSVVISSALRLVAANCPTVGQATRSGR
ncbi:hypothetical protein BS47DRAFT_1341823, partial [Hydnum rufescens UP504]